MTRGLLSTDRHIVRKKPVNRICMAMATLAWLTVGVCEAQEPPSDANHVADAYWESLIAAVGLDAEDPDVLANRDVAVQSAACILEAERGDYGFWAKRGALQARQEELFGDLLPAAGSPEHHALASICPTGDPEARGILYPEANDLEENLSEARGLRCWFPDAGESGGRMAYDDIRLPTDSVARGIYGVGNARLVGNLGASNVRVYGSKNALTLIERIGLGGAEVSVVTVTRHWESTREVVGGVSVGGNVAFWSRHGWAGPQQYVGWCKVVDREDVEYRTMRDEGRFGDEPPWKFGPDGSRR